MHITKEVARQVFYRATNKSQKVGECLHGPTRISCNGKTWNVRKCIIFHIRGQLSNRCSVLPKCGNKKCIDFRHLEVARPGCNFLDGKGYHRGARSLDDKVAQEVRKMRELGAQLKDIAAKIDRSVNTVWSIVHGKHYK